MDSLCLTCSSSLRSNEHTFTTECCQKPICSSCIAANPRLTRYNPCIFCLGGVEVVGARSSKGKQQQLVPPDKVNINGAVRDQDTFILGDDDEDEDEDGEAPPPYLEQTSSQAQEPDLSENSGSPHEYFIQPSDTLHGIALRFGVDVRTFNTNNQLILIYLC